MSGRTFFLSLLTAGLAGLVPATAQADGAPSSAPFGQPVGDEQVYTHLILNQFEGRQGANSAFRWSGEGWAGTDTNRLWVRSEGQVTSRGTVHDSQQEAFYDRPVSPYFDLQAGLRSDIDSNAGRTWAALGVEGLAPYFFELSATAYMSDGGHYAAKLEGSTDWLITQRVILEPQFEMNFYTRNDPARVTGSGLADIDAGLRLRYEFSRKFAPYIGVTYEGKYGRTANLTRAAGDDTSALRFVLGIRAWF